MERWGAPGHGTHPTDAATAGARGCWASEVVTGASLGQGTPEKAPKEEIFCFRVAYVSPWGLGQKEALPAGWVCWGCHELGRLEGGWQRHRAAAKS